MLSNHRRTFLYSLCLLLFLVLLFIGVGRHPPGAAPATTFAPIGRLDQSTYRAMDDIRSVVLSGVARALNVIGGGYVTIPIRAVVSLWLAFRRRWRALGAWVLTWVAAEVLLTGAKAFFHRGRPPNELVATTGYSFPSGHAVAAAATAVALVLVLMAPGARRRKWEALAVLFAFVMAFSRVYLNAHWLSDVVAGVLLGTGVALGSAALATEVRDVAMRMRGSPVRAGTPPEARAGTPP
ncbi:MAG: phosphatase PAP2 family protein [Actinobacteria bacterium]|nr:MAG: phosphatase PAP2 family protein [Actinomycetota bacterium]TMK46963.1 MAG: phosphatase PAP2 family protein [Actinomycetota bacterium]